jgi:hypothetical protein
MKAIKISLAAIVVAAIAFFVIRSIVNTGGIGKISLPENQFTNRITQETDSLGRLPESKFCKDFYREVSYHIDDYAKQGRLGTNESENRQWKEHLTKNLYSKYTEKFISQAFYVFRNSEWKTDDLQSIRSESATLQKSALLEKNSSVDKKLTEIKQIFSKYDEIADFISACKGFSYSSSYLSARFPIADTQTKISRARQYLNNGLDNAYVKNCTRLQEGLKEAPQALFRAHIRYLDRKIDKWSNMYSNYNSQSDYANNLFQPLKRELDLLDNNTYRASNFSGEYSRLLGKLNADSQRAYNYFSSRP